MFNCFSSLGYTQLVDGPTRVSNSGADSTLDLILCNDPMCINVNSIEAPFSNSDHSSVNFSIYSSISVNNDSSTDSDNMINLTCYNWSAANYEAINEALGNLDWHSFFGYYFDANSLWTGFKQIKWPIISCFVPFKSVPHYLKYRPRLYPLNIRKLLTRKAAIWHKLKTSKSLELFNKYKTIANECKLKFINTMPKEKKFSWTQTILAHFTNL